MLRQIQIMFALFFLSAVLGGQERPKIMMNVLTKDGPVTQELWGDELLVKLSLSATQRKSEMHYASSYRPLATATAPSGFERFGVIPYHGTIEGLQAMQASLASDPAFEWVSFSPVFRAFQINDATDVTTDPLIFQQWALLGSFPGSIGWNRLPRLTADHVYVVFADTGACFGHEDFRWERNFWNHNAFDPSKSPTDDNGHGCAVASVVAAKTNNGLGIAGIADFVKFGFVKVLDHKGESDTMTITQGLLAIAQMAEDLKRREPYARVILNLSFGASEGVLPITEAIKIVRQAGVIVVAAAGNSAQNIDRIPVSPASIPGVIAVGASNWENGVGAQGFWASNWGPKTVLLAAPGQDIDVAVPKGIETEGALFSPSGYRRLNGTSLSAPYVDGAIAMMLARFPELTEEQIRVRLMNGDRGMKSWRLNLRNYAPTELFVSGARLKLDGLLDEDWALPAQPYIQVLQTGHSSARILVTGTGDDGTSGKPFGVRCAFTASGSEPQTFEAVPFFGTATENGLEVLLRKPDNSPLQEATAYQITCAVVDKAGNWSAPSELMELQTVESQSAQVDPETFSATEGPIADEVTRWNGRNPLIWHQTEFALLGPAWYAGTNALNYHVGVSDSQLSSTPLDLRGINGSVSITVKQFLQMLGMGPQNSHFDAAEIRIATMDDPDGIVREKIVTEYLPNNRSFGWENFSIDLSEYAGRLVQLRFRFFTNGSSVGIGWIIGQVQIRTDAR